MKTIVENINLNSKPSWKKYEIKTYLMLKKQYPDLKVNYNDHLQGYDSKTCRQIDVILYGECQNDFTIYDCKYWKNPIDITDIDKFYGKLKDVKAKKGAIVSKSGYTKNALISAKNRKIELYSLVDSNNKNLCPNELYTPLLQHFIWPHQYQVKYGFMSGFHKIEYDPKEIILESRGIKFSSYDLFKDLWNNGKLTQDSGEYDFKVEKFLTISNFKNIPVDLLLFKYRVLKKSFLINLKLTKAYGIYDAKLGIFTLLSPELETEKISLEHIINKGKETILSREKTKATFEGFARYILN